MTRKALNRNFIFLASLAAGFLAGDGMAAFSFLNIPVLVLIMTFSVAETDFSAFRDWRRIRGPLAAGVLLNYFFIFALLLALGRLFSLEGDLWAGLVLTAATPPGLAIVPFTAVVGGSVFFSSVAVFAAFFAALAFTPWLTSVFAGDGLISFPAIFRLFLLMLVVPLAAGGVLRKAGLGRFAARWHGRVVNLGFGVIFAVITGVNRGVFFSHPGDVAKLTALFAVSVFGCAYFLKRLLSRMNADREIAQSVILVATVKNSVFGAAAGLTLIGPLGAAPGVVLSLVILIYLVFAEKILK